MLDAPEAELTDRAQRLRDAVGLERAEVVDTAAKVGGGAMPLLELKGPAVGLIGPGSPADIARALRRGDPPVIGRIHDGRVLLDPRTLSDSEVEAAAAAARAALG
jgi:L-seryl-tRNA(Ser) seleniumtransferase